MLVLSIVYQTLYNCSAISHSNEAVKYKYCRFYMCDEWYKLVSKYCIPNAAFEN